VEATLTQKLTAAEKAIADTKAKAMANVDGIARMRPGIVER
jgi:hypothetical protein